MKKIKYVGKHNCSIKFIDGGIAGPIKPQSIISVPDKDYDSLMKLTKTTKEWEAYEKKEVI